MPDPVGALILDPPVWVGTRGRLHWEEFLEDSPTVTRQQAKVVLWPFARTVLEPRGSDR